MVSLLKKLFNRKLMILIAIFAFMFSLFKVGTTLASTDSFTITDVKIASKTETTEVNSFSFEKCKIVNNIVFHRLGDCITYEIKVKNNDDKKYTIKEIKDDNNNEYIHYFYDQFENLVIEPNGELMFKVTEKYVKEVTDLNARGQNFTVNFDFLLEDEQGNVTSTLLNISNPKTGDDIGVYITIAVSTAFILLLLTRKERLEKIRRKYSTRERRSNRIHKTHAGKLKIFSILTIAVFISPLMTKAATNENLSISFDKSETQLKDKLIFTYKIGDKVKEKVIRYGDKIGELEDPRKVGYTYGGWKNEDGTLFDEDKELTDDVNIYADLKTIDYDIKYDLNGGQEKGTNPDTYTVEDEITLKNPVKQGYTFSGWTGSNGDSLQTKVTINKGTIGNKNYKANYSANPDTKYTVIHKLMDVDGVNYTTKDTEELHGATNTQVKPQTKVYDQFKAPEEKIITIGADGKTVLEYKYERNKYLLTLENSQDIESDKSIGEYYYGTEIKLKAKDKKGYTFEKWSNDKTEKEINITITEPLTMKAIYDINSYKVIFNSKGGTPVENITKDYNEKIGTLPISTKDGQIFDGWYTDETYRTKVDENTKVIDDVVYYAKWRDPKDFTITFNANGGSVNTSSKMIKEGQKVGELPIPVKDEYIFEGWYTNTSYNTKVDENVIPSDSTTYYAKWKDRMKTVYYLSGPVNFNGENANITGDTVPELHEQRYIDTGVRLFDEENYMKDFEIGFEIEEYKTENQDKSNTQQTFVNSKYENESAGYPGFVFRRAGTGLEFTCRVGDDKKTQNLKYPAVQKVKIYRINNVLYYSTNDGEKIKFQDLDNISLRFSTPVTFGASTQANGDEFRILNGTLKNLYIKLEDK